MRKSLAIVAVVFLGLSMSTADTRSDCVNACSAQMRDQLKACNDAYKQDGNAANRQQCMAAAKAAYETCVSHCN
jgi:hypothetical protein